MASGLYQKSGDKISLPSEEVFRVCSIERPRPEDRPHLMSLGTSVHSSCKKNWPLNSMNLPWCCVWVAAAALPPNWSQPNIPFGSNTLQGIELVVPTV